MPKQNYILFCIAIILIILFHARTGIAGLLAAGIIFLIYFYLFKKDVVLAFALCIIVNSNPMLLLHPYSLGIPKYLAFTDIFFILSFVSIYSPQVKERRVDSNLNKLLSILFIFVLYQFSVSFLLKAAPDNFREIVRLIYRQHAMYLGVFLVVPSYIIFKVDGKKLITALALGSIIYGIVTILTVYTPIEIFKVTTSLRNGVLRLRLIHGTLFHLIPCIAVAAFIFFGGKKVHIHYYLGGILALAVPFIAMWRWEIFTIVLTLLLVVFIASKYLLRNFVGIVRLIKMVVVVFILIMVLSPHVYRGMVDIYVQTYHELLGTGEIEKGTTQTRTEHELPLHLGMIRENPILGNGWDPRWWGPSNSPDDWGLTDVPVTATLAMYGWLGLIIYYSRFLFILPRSRHVLKAIGKERINLEKNSFHYIVIIALRAYFIVMIFFRYFYIGYELTFTKVYADVATFIGIYMASIYMVESQHGKQKS